MYKKIATLCLIVSVFFIVDNLGAEVITNHMMTKDPKQGSGCETPTPNYIFGSRDTRAYCYLDVDDNWQTIAVPARGLAFSWCQVPVVYLLNDDLEPALNITWDDGTQQLLSQLVLPADESSELFRRSGRIRQITVTFKTNRLFVE